MDQGKGAAKSGPKDTTKIDIVLWSLSNQEILAQKSVLCSKPLQNVVR